MPDLPLAVKGKSSVKQIYHYALVGIASNFAGYMVYLLGTYLGGTPKITMTVLYGVGTAIGFFGNRRLTFAHKGSLLGSGFRYLIAYLLGYLMNLAILIVFVDKLGYAHQWVQAMAVFVVAAFLFLALKFFVFTDLNASGAEAQ